MTLQETVSFLSGEEQQNILTLRSEFTERFPITIKALRLIDDEYTFVKKSKGYNLIKRDSKKFGGFVYYVRYWHNGKMISSKWCTHTNDYEKACLFADQNREKIITEYKQKYGGYCIKFLQQFYDQSSAVFQKESKRNGEMKEVRRKRYYMIINDKFIPFLKEKKIESFNDITVPVLDDFQDYLLGTGIKAQTANDNMAAINKIFNYLVRKGVITVNPCQNLSPIPEKEEDKKTHGCYELEIMKGIFNKRWKDKMSYLLNLIIYTTDMRPIEIKSFCKNDIIMNYGVKFIELKKSKTYNGIRKVPLHEKVYAKIVEYANGMEVNKNIFSDVTNYQFTKAYKELGKMLKLSIDFLNENNITFYSGRHFWKTLMSDAGLGDDIEECFMGHKVTNDVKKLYNHKDMRGKKNIAKKAKEVFRILDARLFVR